MIKNKYLFFAALAIMHTVQGLKINYECTGDTCPSPSLKVHIIHRSCVGPMGQLHGTNISNACIDAQVPLSGFCWTPAKSPENKWVGNWVLNPDNYKGYLVGFTDDANVFTKNISTTSSFPVPFMLAVGPVFVPMGKYTWTPTKYSFKITDTIQLSDCPTIAWSNTAGTYTNTIHALKVEKLMLDGGYEQLDMIEGAPSKLPFAETGP